MWYGYSSVGKTSLENVMRDILLSLTADINDIEAEHCRKIYELSKMNRASLTYNNKVLLGT
jgi:hypothetical protein